MKEIAEKKGLPHSTVRYWFEKYDIKRRPGPEACYYGYWNKHSKGDVVLPYREKKKVTIEKIKKLYYEEGMSVPEMADKFNGSIGSIYKQMKKHGIKRRSRKETNQITFNKKELSFNPRKKLSPKEEKLKIAGVMLYWAEGSKNRVQDNKSRGDVVDFANSDPEMIKIFLRFLREILEIDEKRIRIYLYCYANQNVEQLKEYWSELTKVPLSQFTKPYIREDFSLKKTGRMKYGLVHVRYSDKKLFLQIQKWTKEFLEEMLQA